MKISSVGILLLFLTQAASADTFTTIDITSYLNGNITINPQTVPIGTTTGNQGTIIPFDIGVHGSNGGIWLASSSSTETLDVPVDVSGQASFYALLNNFYGTPGADEYNITIKATNGDSITYQSIGGVDTRDYNANVFTNTIASTTTPWFNNGIGQRLDVREFTLPSTFASDTISDFIITQIDYNDPAVFSGLTFSTGAASFTGTPEPASVLLSAAGIVLVGLSRRFKHRKG
jgi:hypothetical protein